MILRRDITEAKESLSATTSVRITVRGYREPFLIGRPEYEAAIDNCLRRSLDTLVSTVRSAGLSPADLQAVLLAGGASRTPRVSDLLAAELGMLPRTSADPKSVVALGALAAAVPNRPGSPQPGPAGAGDDAPRWFPNLTADEFGPPEPAER